MIETFSVEKESGGKALLLAYFALAFVASETPDEGAVPPKASAK